MVPCLPEGKYQSEVKNDAESRKWHRRTVIAMLITGCVQLVTFVGVCLLGKPYDPIDSPLEIAMMLPCIISLVWLLYCGLIEGLKSQRFVCGANAQDQSQKDKV